MFLIDLDAEMPTRPKQTLKTKYMPKIMSKLTAAYLAGFVDGEGYVSLHKNYNKKVNTMYFTPMIKISSVDKEIIEWLKASFGGWIYVKTYGDDKNYRTAYCWQLTGKNLQPFLSKVFPYLKIKREQCKLVLEKIRTQKFIDLPYRNISKINKKRIDKQSMNKEYRDELRKKNEAIYWQLRKLNHRGKVVQGERLSETPSKKDEAIV